jgi:peptidoglycan-associated lipoprotein
MKISTTICGAATLLVCGGLACSSNQAPVQAPIAESPPAAEPAAPTARNDRETTIRLSEEILSECRFPASPTELPRFELDQATLKTSGKNVLDDVANCMKDGPLQNRTITIIGRADPRGTETHNHQLGANRADAARNYLLQKGVKEEKILVTSRGEEGAAGAGEDTWSLDRRVDFVLGDKTTRTSLNEFPKANADNTVPGPGKPGASYSNQAEGGPAGGKVTGSSGPGTDSVSGK